jgi:hypothetical protein
LSNSISPTGKHEQQNATSPAKSDSSVTPTIAATLSGRTSGRIIGGDASCGEANGFSSGGGVGELLTLTILTEL